MSPARRSVWWVVLPLLLVVNLPLAHVGWTAWRLERDGVAVSAEVTSTERLDDGGLVEFRFEPSIDPEQRRWAEPVEAEAFERIEAAGTIAVTVLPGSPERHVIEGDRGSGGLVALTLFADAALLVSGFLMRRRRVDLLRLVALEDVVVARPGGALEQLDETTYLVSGEVTHRDTEGLVLDVGDRSVRVDLAGFANPVGYQQPARVRARLPESRA